MEIINTKELNKAICKYCDRSCDPIKKCSRDDCPDIFEAKQQEAKEFRQVAGETQKKNIQPMFEYAFELRKVALIDGLKAIAKHELANDLEIINELNAMKNILLHFLDKKEIEQYLATNFPNWDNYRSEIMLKDFFNNFEGKIKTGEIPVNRIRKIIRKYDENKL